MPDLIYSANTSLSLTDSFNQSGIYHVRNPDIEAGNAYSNMLYTASDNDKAPVCIIMEGYRGDGVKGANNIAVADILKGNGFAVVQMNYAGFDHYGRKKDTQKVDQATLATNIHDLGAAIASVPPGRDAILFANSYSINVAVSALLQDKLSASVKHIWAAMPFPNFIQSTVLRQLANSRDQNAICARNSLKKNKFFIYSPDGQSEIKFTKRFLNNIKDNAEDYNLFSKALVGVAHKPSISSISSQNDPVAPISLALKWLDHAHRCGFEIKNNIVLDDASHAFTDNSFCAIGTVAKNLAQEYGL